jgi:hypothetical protein
MAEVVLRLSIVDVYGKGIPEKVDIILTNQVLSEVVKASVNTAQKVDMTGLRGFPQGLYRIEIDSPSYRAVSQFANLKASGLTPLTIPCPIDPAKVKKVTFPTYASLDGDLKRFLDSSEQVLSFEGKKGKSLYDALDDIRRAGLLNIAAETQKTLLTNKRPVISYISDLREIRGDRFFATVSKELREETKNSVAAGLFHPADESLHHPPYGFTPAGSFKTPDHYGNLQLSFFMNGDDCVADIDIDDAAGVEHVFQVLGNALSGQPTHPYNIHEILIGFQQIDPGYGFQV